MLLGAALPAVVAAGGVAWAVGVSGPAGAGTVAAAPAPSAPGGTWGELRDIPGLAALSAGPETAVTTPVKAISCVTPGNCVVVGSYMTSAAGPERFAPFVAAEVNGAWGSAHPVSGAPASPAGGPDILDKVSCGAPGYCAAAGTYHPASGGLFAFLATEADGTWTARALPGVIGSDTVTGSVIRAVSCPAAGDCAAVGEYDAAGTAHAFTLDEAGGTWGAPRPVTGLAGLAPGGSESSSLMSVSCAGPGDCTAGGDYLDTVGAGYPFLASESGGTWGGAKPVPGFSSLPTTVAGGNPAGSVTMVSCPDATGCTAAGVFTAGQASVGVFTADEASGTWGQAKPLNIPSAPTMLDASIRAGCGSAGSCVVIGDAAVPAQPPLSGSTYESFVATEASSGNWGAGQAIPGLTPATGQVAALSCVPGGDCTIVGTTLATGTPTPNRVFAVTVGADGSIGPERQAGPAMDTAPHVTGISCPQAGYCTVIEAPSGAPQVLTEATAATVSLTASVPQATFGAEPSETFTATVSSPAGGTPAGTVTVTGPSGTLCVITLASGTGSCTVPRPSLPGGTDTVTGTYSGDATYIPASGTATVSVARAPTSASLTISPASAAFAGKAATETLTATIAGTGGTPTGHASASVNGKPLASCADVPVAAGKITCIGSAGILPPGRDAFTITYAGDTDFAPSTSAPQYLTISKARTTTGLVLSRTMVTYGHENAEKLTVSVSHVGGTYPSGRVTVTIGGTTICTITLGKGTGSCTLGATRLRPGTYHLAALYPGDHNYRSSTSAIKTLEIAP
jgi:hypothetical protein